ncbi:MAG TPA: DsbA family protein [Acetobacteraceae bacterium]|nr:DsbA family protein [Acetobacteraceae bacterium]
MSASSIDFWFTMGSTYTCLTALRLADVAEHSGLTFNWRPFDFRTLLRERNYSPFPPQSPKTAYMWRDIERRAGMYGFEMRVPAPYPVADSWHANCVALLGMQEGWGPDFVAAAYRRWFLFREENGGEPNLRVALTEAGQNYDRVIPIARSDKLRRDLELQTDEARRLRLVGSPTFIVAGEMFWGDDRLQDAIDWAKHGRVVGCG